MNCLNFIVGIDAQEGAGWDVDDMGWNLMDAGKVGFLSRHKVRAKFFDATSFSEMPQYFLRTSCTIYGSTELVNCSVS